MSKEAVKRSRDMLKKVIKSRKEEVVEVSGVEFTVRSFNNRDWVECLSPDGTKIDLIALLQRCIVKPKLSIEDVENLDIEVFTTLINKVGDLSGFNIGSIKKGNE